METLDSVQVTYSRRHLLDGNSSLGERATVSWSVWKRLYTEVSLHRLLDLYERPSD